MNSCKETAELASQGLVQKLPFQKRLVIRFHLLLCAACRRSRRQMEVLRALFQKYATGDVPAAKSPPLRLSDEARKRIQDALLK